MDEIWNSIYVVSSSFDRNIIFEYIKKKWFLSHTCLIRTSASCVRNQIVFNHENNRIKFENLQTSFVSGNVISMLFCFSLFSRSSVIINITSNGHAKLLRSRWSHKFLFYDFWYPQEQQEGKRSIHHPQL